MYIPIHVSFFRFTLDKDVNLERIAGLLPPNVTGADLYAVCSNAWFSAVRKTIKEIEESKFITNTQGRISHKTH